MATIIIDDLEENRDLDKQALENIRGGSWDDFNRISSNAVYNANLQAIAHDPYRWYQGALYATHVYQPYLNSIHSFGGLMAEADRMIAFGRSLGLGG